MSGPPPTPPPVPPGGPGGGDDAVRIGNSIKTLLDEASQKLSPAGMKTLVATIKTHPVFKQPYFKRK